jgi:hypothetical protein
MKEQPLPRYEVWLAHKELCRKMYVEEECSVRDSRAAYLVQLDVIVARHKASAGR